MKYDDSKEEEDEDGKGRGDKAGRDSYLFYKAIRKKFYWKSFRRTFVMSEGEFVQ